MKRDTVDASVGNSCFASEVVPRYCQRRTYETVFSPLKRTLRCRACANLVRRVPELVPMCAVHDIDQPRTSENKLRLPVCNGVPVKKN